MAEEGGEMNPFAHADGGYVVGRTYIPRRGPRIAWVHDARSVPVASNTGVRGISYQRKGKGFLVNLGRGCTKWVGIALLGRKEAWRQAVQMRADYETAIARVRDQVRRERENKKVASRAAAAAERESKRTRGGGLR